MKKLMVSALISSVLLTGCSEKSSLGSGAVAIGMAGTAVISPLLPDACKAFNKPNDESLFKKCNKKHDYAIIHNDKSGYAIIDKQGNFLMNYRNYYLMQEIKPNYFTAQTYGKINKAGVFDKYGNIIVPFEYKFIDTLDKGKFCGRTLDNSIHSKAFICYDEKGNVVDDK